MKALVTGLLILCAILAWPSPKVEASTAPTSVLTESEVDSWYALKDSRKCFATFNGTLLRGKTVEVTKIVEQEYLVRYYTKYGWFYRESFDGVTCK